MFQAPKLTDAGKKLYYKNLGGAELKFTTIQMGSGEIRGEIAQMTALSKPVVVVEAFTKNNSGQYVDVVGTFSNAELKEGFYWREIGVFVANPDDIDNRDADILYCYQNAYNTADFIPTAAVETVEKSIIIPMIVGNAEIVSCTLSKSAIYVTAKDLEEHKTSYDRKLSQKADLDEHGKVLSQQLPDMNYDPVGSAAAVQANLNTHIADTNNPHKVTTEQIGAHPLIRTSGLLKGDGQGGVSQAIAGTDYVLPSGSITGNAATADSATKLKTARTIHTNLASTSAASFNGTSNVTVGVTGVLPISRGGTGATSKAVALTNLGGQPLHYYYKLSDIGCTNTSTMKEVWTALPANSVLLCDASGFTDASWNLPSKYAMLRMEKLMVGRGSIHVYGKERANCDYRMFLKSDNEPSGEWIVMSHPNTAKIAVGGYTGTGNFGESNPNRILFPFPPKQVTVMFEGLDSYESGCYFVWIGQEHSRSVRNYKVEESDAGWIFSWYSSGSAQEQMNDVPMRYQYVGIG